MATSANLKRAVKRIKATLNANYEQAQVTPTAGPVGTGKAFIGGQVFDANISGVTQVVNVGRPAAAQYAAKVGGVTVTSSGGGGSTSSGGGTGAAITSSFVIADPDALLPNARLLAVSAALSLTDAGAGGAITVGMATPPTLSATSTNDATTGSHAITASAAPGAAESLLKSTSAGLLTLPLYTATTKVTTPLIDTASGALSLRPSTPDVQAVGAFISTAGTTNAGGAIMQGVVDSGNSFAARAWFGHNAQWSTTGDIWNIDDVGANDASGLLLRNAAAAIDFIFHTSTGASSRTMDHSTFTAGAKFTMTSAGRLGVLNTSPSYELDVTGTGRITTSLTTPLITTGTNVDLVINPAGTGAVQFPNDQTLRTSTFDGWAIPYTTGFQINEFEPVPGGSSSVLTIGRIQADELDVRVFVANETRVSRGDEFWTKSFGVLAESFTTPSSIGGTVSVKFEDSPAITGAIFVNSDWVLIRKLEIGTGLSLYNVWGQVATYVNNGDGTQSWTFTLRGGPTDKLIDRGSLGIDFGQVGAALIHLSVVDASGSPYIKLRKWVSGSDPMTITGPNFKTYVQIGELGSISNSYYTPSGFGWYVQPSTSDARFIVADDNGLQIRGASFKMYDGAAQTVDISSTDGSMKLGTDVSSSATTAFDFDASTGDLSITGDLYTDKVYLLRASGLNTEQDVWGSWDNRRAMQWWPSLSSMSGDPSLSMYTGKHSGGSFPNQNWAYIDSNPTGGVLANLSITAHGQGTADDASIYIEGGSQSLASPATVVITAENIDLSGNVDTASLSVGGTAVSLDGHTHSYLPLSGGTLTGTLITDIMRPATNNTKTVGTASYYYNAGYFDSLYVNTIVGPPSYSHTHSASEITSGTLDFARMATTWTGALTLDADASAGSSNYLRLTTQTGSKFWDLIGRAHDYGTSAQQNDLLLTYYDGSTTHVVFHADNATRIIDFGETPTVGGTAVSLSGHTHDDRYYTEAEVTSLLSGYVPTSRTVSAGSGLTGGGALSGNVTISLDTPGSLSATSSNSASGNHTHAITASAAPGAAESLLKSTSAGLLTLPLFTATTSVTTPLVVATSRLGISTGTSGVTESTSYNGVYVHAASNAVVQLLAPNTSTGGITFGDPDDNDVGRILYRHTNDYMDFETGATLRLRIGGGTYMVDVTGTGRFTGTLYADSGATVTGSLTATTSVITPTVTTTSGNLSLTSAGGTVAVTGALTGSSTGVFTSTLTAASDSDAINTFGRVRLGYAAATDTASFAHFDQNTSTNFALSQSASGATIINAISGQTLSLSNAGSATATIGASGIDLQSGKYVGSSNYASQSAGWRVDALGGGDFRYLYADQMHVKAFIADLEQALAGSQIVTKSVAVLASDFIVPYAGGTQLLTVEDLPSASNMAVFESGDLVAMRSFSRAGGSLSATYCYGTVASYSDGTGVQTWTFTRSGTTTYNTITQRGSATSATTSSGNSVAPNKPTGLLGGDKMLAVVTHDGSADTITATGWTIIGEYTSGTDINFAMYYRVAGGTVGVSSTDGSTYTFSTVSNHALAASVVAYYNVDSLIIDDYSISTNGASTNMTGTTVFGTATANMLVFLGGITNNSASTPPSGMTELIDAGSSGIRVYVAHQTLAASGETGSKVATIAASHASIVGMVALRPTYSAMSATAGAAAPGDTIETNTLALDLGVSGNGYYEVSTVDGTYGANSPYAQVVTWTTHPITASVVRTRMGNLKGLFAAGDEYGLYAGNGTSTTSNYLRLSNVTSAFNNIPISMYNAGTQTVNIDSSGTNVWIGPSSSDKRFLFNGTALALNKVDITLYNGGTQTVNIDSAGTNIWVGPSSGDKRLSWNGTTLSVVGAITIASGSSGYSNFSDKPTTLNSINSSEYTKINSGLDSSGNLITKVLPGSTVGTPGGAGLFLGSDKMGYYNGSRWLTYMDNSGNFTFSSATSAKLAWDGTDLYGTDGSNVQWYARASTGKFYAGNGAVVLDRTGILVANDATSAGITLHRTNAFSSSTKSGRLWALSDLSPLRIYFSAGRSVGVDGDASSAAGIMDLVAYNSSGAVAAELSLDGGGGVISAIGAIGEAWTNASYNTGWGSYGGGYHVAQYKKFGDLVFLRGTVVRSSGSATTIFTLPSGYRPTNSMMFSQLANDAVARIAINSSGNVVLQAGAATPWVNLTGIIFSTA